MKPCVYILKIDGDHYYIGSTIDIKRRMTEHRRGKTSGILYSKKVELLFVQEYDSIILARRVEYKLKKFKSRKIIEKILIDGIIKII